MNTKNVPCEALRFESAVSIAAGEGESAARRFEGVAYSGHEITGHWYWGKVIFDLATTEAPAKLPALIGHDRNMVVGFADTVKITDKITVEGPLSDVTPHGKQVAAMSDEGFPWQMSVHIEPGSVEEIKSGATVHVNGHQFAGPGYVFRNARIREVSFTPTGWDDKTSARAMSNEGGVIINVTSHEENAMELEQLQRQVADLTTQITGLQASADAATARADAAEAALADQQRAARVEQVRALFAATGREYSDEAAAPYIAMDATLFAAVSADMKAIKPAAPESLFRTQADDGAPAGGQDALIEKMAAL